MNTRKIAIVLIAFVLLGACPITILRAADVPYFTITNSATLPTNAVIMSPPSAPPSPSGPSILSSPAPAVSFQGLGDDNTRFPPDTDGCVGPNHVVTMLNTQVRVQNRTGTTNYSTTTLQSWWSDKFGFTVSPFDPRILYDPFSNRWIAIAAHFSPPSDSAILIAASETSDPTGGWYPHGWDVDTNNTTFADFPIVGFTQDKVVVTYNSLPLSGTDIDGVGIMVFNKTNLYNDTGEPQFIKQPYQSGSTVNGLGIAPVVSYNTNDPTMYLVQDFQDNSSGSGYLALYTITGSAGSAVLTRSTNFPSASAWASTGAGTDNFGPQLGLSTKIHTGDSRMSQAVYRNGSLWCAHTIYLPADNPTRSAVQWWQISTNGSVLQNGRIDDSSGLNFYAYPSIAVNKFGDALIGYSRFSTNQYASANYALHTLDGLNGSVGSDYVFKSGEAPYWKIHITETDGVITARHGLIR